MGRALINLALVLFDKALPDANILMMARRKKSLETKRENLTTNDDYDVLYGIFKQDTRGDAPRALFGLDNLAGSQHCAYINNRGKSEEECVQMYKQRVTQIMARSTTSF